MKLLITNDDGILSPGIAALAGALCAEHEVTVAAPSTEQSGVSHSLTFSYPLRVKRVNLNGLPVQAYAISGSPVDCVKFACGNLDTPFDMTISGINLGANAGIDVFYSGTVSAAMEAALNGVPAIAASCNSFTPQHLDATAEYVKRMITLSLERGIKLLNLNVPDLPLEDIRGVKAAPLGVPPYYTRYDERMDPHGAAYYWLPGRKPHEYPPQENTDCRWLHDGFATITPLLTDLTDFTAIKDIEQE